MGKQVGTTQDALTVVEPIEDAVFDVGGVQAIDFQNSTMSGINGTLCARAANNVNSNNCALIPLTEHE